MISGSAAPTSSSWMLAKIPTPQSVPRIHTRASIILGLRSKTSMRFVPIEGQRAEATATSAGSCDGGVCFRLQCTDDAQCPGGFSCEIPAVVCCPPGGKCSFRACSALRKCRRACFGLRRSSSSQPRWNSAICGAVPKVRDRRRHRHRHRKFRRPRPAVATAGTAWRPPWRHRYPVAGDPKGPAAAAPPGRRSWSSGALHRSPFAVGQPRPSVRGLRGELGRC